MQFIQRFWSVFNQTTMENEGSVSIIFQNYFRRFSSAFGCCAHVDFFSHFLSHLPLKENRQYLWSWGIWHSIFTSKFLAACSGNTPAEWHLGEQDIYFWLHLEIENAWRTHAFGCHHMVRAGNEGVWFICNFPGIVLLPETLLKVTSFQI